MLYLKYVRSFLEISWDRNSLFSLRVSFEGTISIKVCLIKSILITESNQCLTVNMRLTTREYGILLASPSLRSGIQEHTEELNSAVFNILGYDIA